MNQQEKKKLCDDIEALIFLSDKLAKSFYFKAKELRDMYHKEISQYNEFKELLCGKRLDIKFEMEYLNGNWTVSITGCPDFDTRIIPGEILTQITGNTFNPGIIKMLKDFKTEDGRKFDINFEKTSKDVISGTITEKRENFAPYTDIQDTSTAARKKKVNELYEFFLFLMDNEKLANWLLGQYKKNWKPLFDTECIQHQESS